MSAPFYAFDDGAATTDGGWVTSAYEIRVQSAAELRHRVDSQGRHWRLVSGEVCEPLWGIHYDPGCEPCWTLTHLPTGHSVAVAWTAGELREVARRLRMLPVPWQSSDPRVLDVADHAAAVDSLPHLAASAARVVR